MRPRANRRATAGSGTTARPEPRKQRRLWRQKQVAQVFEDGPEDDIEDGEDLDSGDEEKEDFGQEDNSEVDEAEKGVDDRFSENADVPEPSDEDDDRHDADAYIRLRYAYPAMTFFTKDDGTLDYVLAERRDLSDWKRFDRLARLLQERFGDRLLAADAIEDRLKQTDLIDALEGGVEPRDVSMLVHSTLICVQGRYFPASTFFRENVSRTENARGRAEALLANGDDKAQAQETLETEFNASRATVSGWIAVAKCRLMIRKLLAQGCSRDAIVAELILGQKLTEKVAQNRVRELEDLHDAQE